MTFSKQVDANIRTYSDFLIYNSLYLKLYTVHRPGSVSVCPQLGLVHFCGFLSLPRRIIIVVLYLFVSISTDDAATQPLRTPGPSERKELGFLNDA